MNIYVIATICFVYDVSADFQMLGMMSVEIVSGNVNNEDTNSILKNNYEESDSIKPVYRVVAGDNGKETLTTDLECVYKYPEQKHLDALLSAILNLLTKMFVRINESQEEVQRTATRFRVVQKIDSRYFDQAYTRLSHELRSKGLITLQHYATVTQSK
ncbi:unnamed protein product [Leptidea sinapis]|uniref:Uncharacterized protein n=1 Tax=Leptidea sinapis TaxID=189913 RepID=A0A5E4R4B7_9NEOP|nr:unnamed protein product [Leptidea sinapis]